MERIKNCGISIIQGNALGKTSRYAPGFPVIAALCVSKRLHPTHSGH
jgi:hypothetical protein